MTDQVRPEEAARALTEIGQRQEQVIRLAVIPDWYWWAIAVLMVAFAVAVDTRQGLVVGIGTAVGQGRDAVAEHPRADSRPQAAGHRSLRKIAAIDRVGNDLADCCCLLVRHRRRLRDQDLDAGARPLGSARRARA